MASSDSFIKNDREWAFASFQNLLSTSENKSKSFSNIRMSLKKFIFTSFSINIFNFSIESKILQIKDQDTEEVNDIYKALKYYIKLNLANTNYLLRKTEIIHKLLIKLINEINRQEDYIFENENIKIYKKIIKYFYDLNLILIKLKDSITYEDKYLNKSIRQISNFLTNLNSFRSDFDEKNISTFFIDFIYLGISQITGINSKSSLGTIEEPKNTYVLGDIDKLHSIINNDKQKNSNDEKLKYFPNNNDKEYYSDFKNYDIEDYKTKNGKKNAYEFNEEAHNEKNNFVLGYHSNISIKQRDNETGHIEFIDKKLPNHINNNLNSKIGNKELISHSQNYQHIANPLNNKTENDFISNVNDIRTNDLDEISKNRIIDSLNKNKDSLEEINSFSTNNYIPDQNKNSICKAIDNQIFQNQIMKNSELKIKNTNSILHSQNKILNPPYSIASISNSNPEILKDFSKNINYPGSNNNLLNKQNLVDFTMYEAKLKNFTKVYFKTDEFLRDLRTTKSRDINEYYNSLENIIYNYYKDHLESFTKFPKLDEKNFNRVIKTLFPDCKSKLIGSYLMKYLTNLKENDGVIDCLIKLDNDGKDGNAIDPKSGKSSLTKINFDKSHVIKCLDNFENENFKIIIKTSSCRDFLCYNTLRILVESKKLDNKCLVDLFFFNEMYYYSNFMLEKIFHPETNDSFKNTNEIERNPKIDFKKFIKLHLFFQEILLKNIQVICFTRFQLSVLILSFLDLEYEIFNKNEKGRFNLEKMYLPDINLDNPLEENEFKLRQNNFYFYKLKSKNFERLVENVRLGELIDGFFRYILCYLTFFKNTHFEKKGKNNREFVDGYEILCKNFKKESQPHLHDDEYIFNHIEITNPLYNQNQGFYNNRFVKFFKSLSNLYFKILEHSKSFKNYSEIMFNIEKFVKD